VCVFVCVYDSLAVCLQLIAAPFVAGALFLDPPFAFISLIPGYIFGELINLSLSWLCPWRAIQLFVHIENKQHHQIFASWRERFVVCR